MRSGNTVPSGSHASDGLTSTPAARRPVTKAAPGSRIIRSRPLRSERTNFLSSDGAPRSINAMSAHGPEVRRGIGMLAP